MTVRSLHEALHRAMRGKVITPGDAEYDAARQVWNAMIDRRPEVIVRCAGPSDVPPLVAFARDRGLELAIRGGGHNIAGSALCDGGVVADLSRMTGVYVDPDQRSRRVVSRSMG